MPFVGPAAGYGDWSMGWTVGGTLESCGPGTLSAEVAERPHHPRCGVLMPAGPSPLGGEQLWLRACRFCKRGPSFKAGD